MRNVHDFLGKFFVLRAPWIKPRRMHPTFMRCVLIVSEIKFQVALDPELNLGNYTSMALPPYLCILNLVQHCDTHNKEIDTVQVKLCPMKKVMFIIKFC